MLKRSNVLKSLGEFPKKCNLNVKIIKSIEKRNHIVNIISYNVEPDERIKALLLVPKSNTKKMPGILALHQHACEYGLGKSETAGIKGNDMYAYGLELCLEGYVVLCPDNLCFEERQDEKLDGMWYERFAFMKYLLKGSSLQAKYISDLSCALDVLKLDKRVDKNNIGVIGHSLGGQEALWLMWYEKSIKAGISSCGFSKIGYILKNKINHNFSLYLPNFLKYGDIDSIVSSIAPRPFLMISGIKDDICPVKGVREIERKAKEAYLKLKSRENFKTIYSKHGHIFPGKMRQKAYKWLNLHLKQ